VEVASLNGSSESRTIMVSCWRTFARAALFRLLCRVAESHFLLGVGIVSYEGGSIIWKLPKMRSM